MFVESQKMHFPNWIPTFWCQFWWGKAEKNIPEDIFYQFWYSQQTRITFKVPGFKANLMAHQSMSSNRIHPYSWLSLAFTVQCFVTEHDEKFPPSCCYFLAPVYLLLFWPLSICWIVVGGTSFAPKMHFPLATICNAHRAQKSHQILKEYKLNMFSIHSTSFFFASPTWSESLKWFLSRVRNQNKD